MVNGIKKNKIRGNDPKKCSLKERVNTYHNAITISVTKNIFTKVFQNTNFSLFCFILYFLIFSFMDLFN